MEASDDGAVSLKLQEMGLLPVRIGRRLARRTSAARNRMALEAEKGPAQGPSGLHPGASHARASRIPAGSQPRASSSQLAESPAMAEVVQDVLKEVKGGKSFSEALAKYPEVFPKVYVNMVKAGEAGGVLEEILGRLATYLETSENLRSYIIGALIYPVLLSVVGIASVTILTLFVVPQIRLDFSGHGSAAAAAHGCS